jgi:hypothetical protein
MPNKNGGHKPRSSRGRRIGQAPRARRIHSVKDLLGKGRVLNDILRRSGRQQDLQKWLESQLPEGLRACLTGVVEKDGNLVVFTQSSAWCARVRYALADMDTQLRTVRPQLGAVVVRVMPRG